MRKWSLRLVFSCTGLVLSAPGPEAGDQADALYAALPELHAAIGQDESGNIEFQLTAEAPTLGEAISQAIGASERAAGSAGMGDVDLIGVEAMTWEAFEVWLER